MRPNQHRRSALLLILFFTLCHREIDASIFDPTSHTEVDDLLAKIDWTNLKRALEVYNGVQLQDFKELYANKLPASTQRLFAIYLASRKEPTVLRAKKLSTIGFYTGTIYTAHLPPSNKVNPASISAASEDLSFDTNLLTMLNSRLKLYFFELVNMKHHFSKPNSTVSLEQAERFLFSNNAHEHNLLGLSASSKFLLALYRIVNFCIEHPNDAIPASLLQNVSYRDGTLVVGREDLTDYLELDNDDNNSALRAYAATRFFMQYLLLFGYGLQADITERYLIPAANLRQPAASQPVMSETDGALIYSLISNNSALLLSLDAKPSRRLSREVGKAEQQNTAANFARIFDDNRNLRDHFSSSQSGMTHSTSHIDLQDTLIDLTPEKREAPKGALQYLLKLVKYFHQFLRGVVSRKATPASKHKPSSKQAYSPQRPHDEQAYTGYQSGTPFSSPRGQESPEKLCGKLNMFAESRAILCRTLANSQQLRRSSVAFRPSRIIIH